MEGKITKIFNAADQIQAEMIHDHLKQNGIESMSKQPGTGEYMSITMGYSVYGTDIYVREDQNIVVQLSRQKSKTFIMN